jgi:hypothetical protein
MIADSKTKDIDRSALDLRFMTTTSRGLRRPVDRFAGAAC